MLGVEVGPHTTVAYGLAVREGDPRGSLSIEVKASDHGWAPAWTLPAMKSSCGPETKTPGCTHCVGAVVGIDVPVATGEVVDTVVIVVNVEPEVEAEADLVLVVKVDLIVEMEVEVGVW